MELFLVVFFLAVAVGVMLVRNHKTQAFPSDLVCQLCFEHAPHATVMHCSAGRILAANPAFCRLTSVSQKSLLGKKIGTLPGFGHYDALFLAHREALCTEEEVVLEMPARKTSQHEGRFSVHLSKSNTTTGEVVLAVFRELPDGHDADMSSALEESRYRELFENVPLALVMLDVTAAFQQVILPPQQDTTYASLVPPDALHDFAQGTKVVDSNPAAWTIAGVTSKGDFTDSFGRLLSSLSFSVIMQELVAVQRGGREFSGECSVRALDGETRYIGFHCLILPETPDEVRRYVLASAVDLTAQKSLENEVQLRMQQLVQADKLASLGLLLSEVVHQINSPNQQVAMSVSLLQKDWGGIRALFDDYEALIGKEAFERSEYADLRDRGIRLLQHIGEGAGRIAETVQELREFSRPDAVSHMEEVNINEVVRSGVLLLSTLLKRSTSHFSVSYGDGFPPVHANFRRLEHVVVNLLQNACQALPNSESAVGVWTGYNTDTSEVYIKIVDEGVGIPFEDLPRITQSFYTTKREQGGTGLGLAIVSTIVSEHSGRLKFSSQVGEGTAVTVWLPCLPTQERDG